MPDLAVYMHFFPRRPLQYDSRKLIKYKGMFILIAKAELLNHLSTSSMPAICGLYLLE